MSEQIEVNFTFRCPECNTAIDHKYTQNDIETLEYLDLICQNCGHKEKANCQMILDKTLAEVKMQYLKEIQN